MQRDSTVLLMQCIWESRIFTCLSTYSLFAIFTTLTGTALFSTLSLPLFSAFRENLQLALRSTQFSRRFSIRIFHSRLGLCLWARSWCRFTLSTTWWLLFKKSSCFILSHQGSTTFHFSTQQLRIYCVCFDRWLRNSDRREREISRPFNLL